MTREDSMGLDAEERALAERLRLLRQPEPPADLDQRIRAHARAAVLRRPRWGWGMGVAATAVLSAVMLQQTMQDSQQPVLPELAPTVTTSAPTSPEESGQDEPRRMAPEDTSAEPSSVSSIEQLPTEPLSPTADQSPAETTIESRGSHEAEWAPDPPSSLSARSAPASQEAAKAAKASGRSAEESLAKPAPSGPESKPMTESELARESDAEEARSPAVQPSVAPFAAAPVVPAPAAPQPAAAPPVPSSAPGRNQPAAPSLRLEVSGARAKRQAVEPDPEFASFDEGVIAVRRWLAEGQGERARQAAQRLHELYPAETLPDDLDALLRTSP